MATEVAEFRIEGISPLLMHSPKGMVQQPEGATGRGRVGKNIPLPEDEAKAGLYALPNGRLFITADAVRNACLIAAKGFQDKSRRGRASFVQRLASAVFAAESEYLLERPKGKAITSDRKDWEIDSRRAVIQHQGIIRNRPSIFPWAATIRFEVDTDILEPSAFPILGQILDAAGRFPGLLDYRPSQGGPFGRFRVVK